ncbi:MAG: hypothetical protein FWE18_00825 [Alphaproteobacteria bacterium]|nr:hypothetical protein [Alphaproteobacteria bacterium]
MNRTLIKISGIDAESFLQNLITNDIKTENQAIYSCLLSPRGKYQFDFFVIKIENYFLIDIAESQAQKFLDALKYRKLIAKVNFEILKNYHVYNTAVKITDSLVSFQDTRLSILGFRTIAQNSPSAENILFNYEELRYKNAVPESDDFNFDKSIPIEFGMDELGALSYSKGCYLGQEFTNSAKNKLAIRKRVISIYADFSLFKDEIITTKNGTQAGRVIAARENLALALFSMSFMSEDIFINKRAVKKHIPKWIKIYSLD